MELNPLKTINQALAPLTPRQRDIIQLRYGLKSAAGETLAAIGKRYNVTRERIRQIEAKALRKLRHPSRSRRLKAFLEGKQS